MSPLAAEVASACSAEGGRAPDLLAELVPFVPAAAWPVPAGGTLDGLRLPQPTSTVRTTSTTARAEARIVRSSPAPPELRLTAARPPASEEPAGSRSLAHRLLPSRSCSSDPRR